MAEQREITKWNVARRVGHRSLRPDGFTNEFFDPFGTTKKINLSFNLRNPEFDKRYDAGEYDNLKRQLELRGADCEI